VLLSQGIVAGSRVSVLSNDSAMLPGARCAMEYSCADHASEH